MKLSASLIFFSSLVAGAEGSDVPMLNVDGFSWAEQLVFDGRGNMFVSEAIRGELWRIHLCEDNSDTYCSEIYLNEGFNQFGGLVVSPDGLNLYAGATLDDGSYALISTPTTGNSTYSIILATAHQPNGLVGDFKRNVLYYTDEGTGSPEGGTLRRIDLDTETDSIVKDHLDMPDGLWYDESAELLYVGMLLTMKVSVFDLKGGEPVIVDSYPGCDSLDNVKHMLDDITLLSESNTENPSKTQVLGADWTGRSIQQFSLDGKYIHNVPTPEGITLKEPTSVRWGSGPGFDAKSLYVTEGGGVTPRQTNRRVLQIPIKTD